EWNTIQRGVCFDLTIILVRLSRPKIVPSRRIGQIQSPVTGVSLKHRTNENGGSKHELVANVTNSWIRAPIHNEWPLDTVVVTCDPPGQRVDVWHQAVPELVELDQDGFDFVE